MADDELKFEPDNFEETPPRNLNKETQKPRITSKPKTSTIPPYREGALVAPLSMAYAMFGLGIGTIEYTQLGKEHMPIGTAISESAEHCARAWDKAAKTNPALRKILYKVIGSSNLIAISVAHVPIAMAVANEMPATQRLAKGIQSFINRMDFSNGPVPEPDDTAQNYPA